MTYQHGLLGRSDGKLEDPHGELVPVEDSSEAGLYMAVQVGAYGKVLLEESPAKTVMLVLEIAVYGTWSFHGNIHNNQHIANVLRVRQVQLRACSEEEFQAEKLLFCNRGAGILQACHQKAGPSTPPQKKTEECLTSSRCSLAWKVVSRVVRIHKGRQRWKLHPRVSSHGGRQIFPI